MMNPKKHPAARRNWNPVERKRLRQTNYTVEEMEKISGMPIPVMRPYNRTHVLEIVGCRKDHRGKATSLVMRLREVA